MILMCITPKIISTGSKVHKIKKKIEKKKIINHKHRSYPLLNSQDVEKNIVPIEKLIKKIKVLLDLGGGYEYNGGDVFNKIRRCNQDENDISAKEEIKK